MIFSIEGISAFYTKRKEIQSHVTFCSHLRTSCDVEHARSDNIYGTTIERCNHYDSPIHTLSACGLIPRLNTNSSGSGLQMTTSSRIGFHETSLSQRHLPQDFLEESS
ncbi:hypothetical protein TNCV_918581 [Trichonephila clavipes]|nr:hypothetical protein TNCV_918581 [Trichonephila clavipes]